MNRRLEQRFRDSNHFFALSSVLFSNGWIKKGRFKISNKELLNWKGKATDGEAEKDVATDSGGIHLRLVVATRSEKERRKREERGRRKEKTCWGIVGHSWLAKGHKIFQQATRQGPDWLRKKYVEDSVDEGRRIWKRNGKTKVHSESWEKSRID